MWLLVSAVSFVVHFGGITFWRDYSFGGLILVYNTWSVHGFQVCIVQKLTLQAREVLGDS